MNQLRIGLAGLGTVGGGVWRHFQANRQLLEQRTGVEIILKKIAVRNREKGSALGVPDELLTSDFLEIARDPEIDLVVELIGGTKEAYQLCKAALENGKHLVTANKALLAAHGEELFKIAARQKRQLLFEGSVAGGIPIIKALREGLIANHILALHGIINGTCNYILWRMSRDHLEFAEALSDAKKFGYAEADESLDVDGHDAAHKAAILAALAYGFWVPQDFVFVEGIRQVERQDMVYAKKLGYELKLLAIIKKGDANAVEVRVQPTLIPLTHVLASISDAFNAILVRGDVVGDTLFYGRGAGADATASAVLGDIAEIASNFPESRRRQPIGGETPYQKLKSIDEIVSRYYLRLNVLDQPGVLGKIASLLGEHKIGISSVIQPESKKENARVPLIFMVHDALEKEFQKALEEISQLPVVQGRPVRWRVEDFS